MKIQNLLAAVGLGIGLLGAAASAQATTFDYSISGSLAGELISGSGVGTYSGGEVSGITFTVGDLAGSPFSAYAGTYTDVSLFSTPNHIVAVDTTAGPGWTPVIVLSGLFNQHLFSSGGSGLYGVLLGYEGSFFTVPAPFSGAIIGVQISAVPLPGAVALFGTAIAGLGGLGFLRRRKV